MSHNGAIRIGLVLVCLAFLAVQADASILTFVPETPVGSGELPLSYGSNVTSTFQPGVGYYEQGNGWTPNITTDYQYWYHNGSEWVIAWHRAPFAQSGYGDLVYALYMGIGRDPSVEIGEIDLIAAPGHTVTLNSFEIGAWNQQPGRTVWVLDQNGAVLWTLTDQTYASTHTDYEPEVTSSDGGTLRLRFDGPYWAGMDNVNFDQDMQHGAVPEPGTATLLGLATAALLALRSRR
jgi:hypothetical protein